jgi:hypothetical protein
VLFMLSLMPSVTFEPLMLSVVQPFKNPDARKNDKSPTDLQSRCCPENRDIPPKIRARVPLRPRRPTSDVIVIKALFSSSLTLRKNKLIFCTCHVVVSS